MELASEIFTLVCVERTCSFHTIKYIKKMPELKNVFTLFWLLIKLIFEVI